MISLTSDHKDDPALVLAADHPWQRARMELFAGFAFDLISRFARKPESTR